jgi:hypothetical protein
MDNSFLVAPAGREACVVLRVAPFLGIDAHYASPKSLAMRPPSLRRATEYEKNFTPRS